MTKTKKFNFFLQVRISLELVFMVLRKIIFIFGFTKRPFRDYFFLGGAS